MKCTVVRRTQKLGHSDVRDDVLLAAAVLAIQDGANQRSCVSDDEAARLHEQREFRFRDKRKNELREAVEIRRRLIVIAHAEPASDVEVPHRRDARALKLLEELQQSFRADSVWLDARQLRAEMHVETDEPDVLA